MRTMGMPGQMGFTASPISPLAYNNGRISIFLSSDTNWSAYPEDYALGVLLHEMLHAYFMVWCRDNTLEMIWEPGQHPGHGQIFMAAARKIGKKMAVDLTDTTAQLVEAMQHSACGNATGQRPMMQGDWLAATMTLPPMW